MRKNYSLNAGNIVIFDDEHDAIEVRVGNRRYVAKTYSDAIVNGSRHYGVREMDDINHKHRDIGCVAGKLNAVNLILKDAGAVTYQTLTKRMSA